MTVSEELLATIEGEISRVSENRSIGMSFNDYCGEYSRLMGQISVDKVALLAAKMPIELFEKYPAYLYVLTEEHADRQVTEGTGSAASTEFKNEMPKAELARDILVVVVEFIISEIDDPSLEVAYKRIIAGDTKMAKLNDIIGLASIVEKHLDIAAKITVGGVEPNKEYLDVVRAHAHKLIDLKGLSSSSVTERSKHVDRQNRIFTLCKNAEDKIKLFAKGAFVMDKEYYREHYSNHVLREINRQRQKALDESEVDLEETIEVE